MYQLTKKSNPVLKFLVILLIISTSLELTKVFFSSPGIDEQMANTANEINKHCPMIIDSLTKPDNATALPGNMFQFNYTFTQSGKETIDTMLLQMSMKPGIIDTINTDPKFKIFKENNVAMSATFHDNAGNYVCNVFIGPADYNNPRFAKSPYFATLCKKFTTLISKPQSKLSKEQIAQACDAREAS